jgi:hypothetical protein
VELTPEERTQADRLCQVKVDLLECYTAELGFATFLMECLEKYGSGLPLDEMFKAKALSNRMNVLIGRIKASVDESPPPGKLPVYYRGGPRTALRAYTESRYLFTK